MSSSPALETLRKNETVKEILWAIELPALPASWLAGSQPMMESLAGTGMHLQGLRTRSNKSLLWKHCVLENVGEEADFKMEMVTSHLTCLDR